MSLQLFVARQLPAYQPRLDVSFQEMQADVVLISYKRVGLFPLHNPTALVVMYATPADVDTVLVAGKVVNRGGKLQGVDYAALMRKAEASADYLYSQSKMDARPASYALQA